MFYSLHVSILVIRATQPSTVTFVQYFPRHRIVFSLFPLILFFIAIILTERKKLDVRALFSA